MYHPIRKNGKMLTGSIYTTPGFRICIYNGSNREEAILAKQDFIKLNKIFQFYKILIQLYYFLYLFFIF